MRSPPSAIVIGAGIGGLAAGIALRRAGIDVDVFERADEIREVGAGISLWANALRALDTLGLTKAIESVSVASAAVGLRSWQGRLLTIGPAQLLDTRVLCIVVHRADLLAALLHAFGAEHVHLGARCVGFQQNAAGAIAEFADGSRARADLLIGADGLHSVVRAQLHGQRPPTYAGYTAWRAVVRFAPHAGGCESWGRGARFGQVPMSDGRVYWYATENAPEGGRHADEKAALLHAFRGWHAPIEALIDATDAPAILRNDIYDRPVLKTWGEGRATLLGDAAHPMTPNLGQGACQALEDAVALARCLREASDVVSAARSYEALRIPRANAVVTQSRRVGRIGQWQHPVAVYLRDALVSRISPRLQARQLARVIGSS